MVDWRKWVAFSPFFNLAVIVTAIGFGFRPDILQGAACFVAIVFGPLALMVEEEVKMIADTNAELLVMPEKVKK